MVRDLVWDPLFAWRLGWVDGLVRWWWVVVEGKLGACGVVRMRWSEVKWSEVKWSDGDEVNVKD
jgi:hypothetical protein